MGNRLPYYILGVLVLIALIWRIANPPPPVPVGPVGTFPTWRSNGPIGEMSSQSTNPSGAAWAGAWNLKTEEDTFRSAIWIIDFQKYKAAQCELEKGLYVTDISWADDDTLRALAVDSDNPEMVTESKVLHISAKSADIEKTTVLKTNAIRAIAWRPGADEFLAQLSTLDNGLKFAVLSETGEVIGKEFTIEAPKGSALHTDAAVSADGDMFVLSILDKTAGGGRAYYIGSPTDGAAHAFYLEDLPGRTEGIWVSGAGVLMVCAQYDKLYAVTYDLESGEIVDAKKSGQTLDMSQWPDAPANMKFVTYNGGFDFDLAKGATKKIFDYKKLKSSEDGWRQVVQDGRLYPLGKGYISVNVTSGEPDIRQLDKDGKKDRDLLPRY